MHPSSYLLRHWSSWSYSGYPSAIWQKRSIVAPCAAKLHAVLVAFKLPVSFSLEACYSNYGVADGGSMVRHRLCWAYYLGGKVSKWWDGHLVPISLADAARIIRLILFQQLKPVGVQSWEKSIGTFAAVAQRKRFAVTLTNASAPPIVPAMTQLGSMFMLFNFFFIFLHIVLHRGVGCCNSKCCTREIISAPRTAALNSEAPTKQIGGTTAFSTELTSRKSCCAGCSPVNES